MLYTSSYFTLPKNFEGIKVQISNSKPKFFEVDRVVKELMPDWKYVQQWKENSISWDEFTTAYNEKIGKYDMEKVKNWLINLGKGRDVVLLCWEKDEYCHRHILGKALGISEFQEENPSMSIMHL